MQVFTKRSRPLSRSCNLFFFGFFELGFVSTTEGAFKIFGELRPFGAGLDTFVFVAKSFVVDVTAKCANVFHKKISFGIKK